MGTSSSFTDVMARLRAGDEDAARQVFQRFVHRLVGLARVRLGRDLRRRVDPEEVVQSAYKSFFLRYEEGKVEVRDWGSLWSLLTVITLRKCIDRVDYHRAQGHNIRREAKAGAEAISGIPFKPAISCGGRRVSEGRSVPRRRVGSASHEMQKPLEKLGFSEDPVQT